jgi:hypothetical protein
VASLRGRRLRARPPRWSAVQQKCCARSSPSWPVPRSLSVFHPQCHPLPARGRAVGTSIRTKSDASLRGGFRTGWCCCVQHDPSAAPHAASTSRHAAVHRDGLQSGYVSRRVLSSRCCCSTFVPRCSHRHVASTSKWPRFGHWFDFKKCGSSLAALPMIASVYVRGLVSGGGCVQQRPPGPSSATCEHSVSLGENAD